MAGKPQEFRRVPLSVVCVETAMRWWASEARNEEICAALGIRRGALERMKVDLQLPNRPARKSWHKPHKTPKKPDPEISEEEVQHRIAKVQATWTDEMFVLRSQGRVRPKPYEFPTISLSRSR
jgi:hypothetical protein